MIGDTSTLSVAVAPISVEGVEAPVASRVIISGVVSTGSVVSTTSTV